MTFEPVADDQPIEVVETVVHEDADVRIVEVRDAETGEVIGSNVTDLTAD